MSIAVGCQQPITRRGHIRVENCNNRNNNNILLCRIYIKIYRESNILYGNVTCELELEVKSRECCQRTHRHSSHPSCRCSRIYYLYG